MTPDQPVTLAVAVVGMVLALSLPRKYAILPLALSLCLYPSNLMLPPGNIGLSAQRVIALSLLFRCVLTPEIRRTFKWQLVDTVAITYFLLLLTAQLMTTEFQQALINRVGFGLSAIVPFFCVRMLIVDKDSFYALFKGWIWACVPLVILALDFMKRGDSPYYAIMQYSILWAGPQNRSRDQRLLWGVLYYRAHAPFQQCIMFGWFFSLIIAPATAIWFQKRRLMPHLIPWLMLPIGTISSIASGAMMLAALSTAMLPLFVLRRFWKWGAYGALTFVLAVLVFAKRDPMAIIASMGMDPHSSWYRVGLQKFVMNYGMGGHWIAGWGQIPNTPLYNKFHDLCIHWIGLLVIHGLMGVVGFYGLVAACSWNLFKSKDKAQTLEDQYLGWTLMSALIASQLALLVVSLFSEMQYIYHMFLALAANGPLLVAGNAARQIGVLVQVDGKPTLLRYTAKPGQKLALVMPQGEAQSPAAQQVRGTTAQPPSPSPRRALPGKRPGP